MAPFVDVRVPDVRNTYKNPAMTLKIYEDIGKVARLKNRHRLAEERRNSNAFKRGERGQPRRRNFVLFFSSVFAGALFATPCAADCNNVWRCTPYCYYHWTCYSPFNNGEIQTALQYCNPSYSNAETFENCHDYYGVHISDWDVSRVGDMNNLFGDYMMYTNTESFKADISRWDVSSVTNMYGMFQNAQHFNGDLSRWDVSSVTNMYGMFQNAQSFNSDLSNWNTHAATSMSYMFSNAQSFNSDLSNWNTHAVTSMSYMFSNAQSFNSDLSNWNTHAVTSMSSMFQHAQNFNGDISRWNTQSLEYMQNMFKNAKSFDADITKWTCDAYERSRTRNNVDNMFTGADAWHASYVNTHAGYFDRDLGPPNMWMPNGAYKKESTKDKVYIALFALMGTAMLAMAIYLIVRCATHRKRTAKKVTTQFRIAHAHAHAHAGQQQNFGMAPMPPGAPVLPGRSPIVVTLPAAAPATAAPAQDV